MSNFKDNSMEQSIESDKQQCLITDDILPAVFAYLNWKDIIYTQQVCKQWKEAAGRTVIPSSSMLPIIFGYLDWKEILILCVRGTCTQWCEATRHTLVPPSDEKKIVFATQGTNPPKDHTFPQFHVNTSRRYNMLNMMRKVMPNLQQIHLSEFQGRAIASTSYDGIVGIVYETTKERYLDEGETNEDGAYDVSIIADFRNLRSLVLNYAPLHGEYPCFFGFKQLRELSINQGGDYCDMVWDLKMLSCMPLIEKLTLICSKATGSISDLHFLKNTLLELVIVSLPNQRAVDDIDICSMDLLSGCLLLFEP